MGTRWYKVNLHVHAQANDPAEVVNQARQAEIDLVVITDHQSFNYIDAVLAAAVTPGRSLTVLPGMEITSHEGAHLLAAFPQDYSIVQRTHFLGFLEIPGSGDTKIASRRTVSEILEKIEKEGGVVVVPHPFTAGIGLFDSARKMSTKKEWLESGYIRLIQIAEDKVKFLDRDKDRNWISRFVLASAPEREIQNSKYSLSNKGSSLFLTASHVSASLFSCPGLFA